MFKSKAHNCIVLTAISLLTLTIAPYAMAETTPTDAYMQFRKKEMEVKGIDDLAPFRSKRSLEKDKTKPMTAEEKTMMFAMMKEIMPKEVVILGQEVKGSEATLHATVKQDPAKEDPKVKETTTGTIVLLLEDGQWKIDSEKWDSKIVSTKDP